MTTLYRDDDKKLINHHKYRLKWDWLWQIKPTEKISPINMLNDQGKRVKIANNESALFK